MEKLQILRSSWPDNFPDVIIHNDLSSRDNHTDYNMAKSGDGEAGLRLARHLMSEESINEIKKWLVTPDVFLAPVTALETLGFNAIPDSMAMVLKEKLSLPVDGDIIQSNKVGHTKAKGWHRFVTPALFEGAVKSGAYYILVDDHIGHGGTLANMRGYIEQNGGSVLLMTTLTETRQARQIRLSKQTHDMLLSKHGQPLEYFWQHTFGYGLNCLTELEAAYLCRQPSLDTIREAMAAAAEEAGRRGLSTVDIV